MTNSTNDPAAIDAAVAALRNGGADLSAPMKQGHAGVIYSSADDSFTETSPAPAAGITAQPLLDDGRDLEAAHAAIIANVDALQARLDGATFNPTTGEKTFTVTGREREVLEAQLRQAKISGAYDIGQLNKIHAQRVSGTQPNATPMPMDGGRTSTLEEEAARMAYIDSAPPGQRVAYAAEYDRLMQGARARSVTGAVAAARGR
jgi:hypothetical protein